MDTLEKRFKEQWPAFFRDVTCGFYLPKEWEGLLWTTCSVIECYLENYKIPLETVQVVQVKEKFKGLLFYYELHLKSSEEGAKVRAHIQGVVRLAESLSYTSPYAIKGRKC